MSPHDDESHDVDLVLVHTEPDPLLAAALRSEFERVGVGFAARERGLAPPLTGSLPGGRVEFWVDREDLHLARHVLATVLPEVGAGEDEEPFDEPDLPADITSVAPFKPEADATLYWRRTESGAFVLHDAAARYALLIPDGGWRFGATVHVHDATWTIEAAEGDPGRLTVHGYGGLGPLVLDLEGDEPASLVREEDGEPITPIRSGDGEIWETEDDWVIRLHEASGPRTERFEVELDAAFGARTEILLLLAIAAFSRKRSEASTGVTDTP